MFFLCLGMYQVNHRENRMKKLTYSAPSYGLNRHQKETSVEGLLAEPIGPQRSLLLVRDQLGRDQYRAYARASFCRWDGTDQSFTQSKFRRTQDVQDCAISAVTISVRRVNVSVASIKRYTYPQSLVCKEGTEPRKAVKATQKIDDSPAQPLVLLRNASLLAFSSHAMKLLFDLLAEALD
jgi:hypothetical protein